MQREVERVTVNQDSSGWNRDKLGSCWRLSGQKNIVRVGHLVGFHMQILIWSLPFWQNSCHFGLASERLEPGDCQSCRITNAICVMWCSVNVLCKTYRQNSNDGFSRLILKHPLEPLIPLFSLSQKLHAIENFATAFWLQWFNCMTVSTENLTAIMCIDYRFTGCPCSMLCWCFAIHVAVLVHLLDMEISFF